MKRVKTSELTGAALDWAVAQCEGVSIAFDDEGAADGQWEMYSTNWSQGGPIIEREGLDIYYSSEQKSWAAAKWVDLPGGGQLQHKQVGNHTALIAAMRCFVTSKLGNEVDVPEELT